MKLEIGNRGVQFPLGKAIEAIPTAIAAAKASGADDRDPASPGGVKVTAAEAAEDFCAFMTAWAEALLPAVLDANGLDMPEQPERD